MIIKSSEFLICVKFLFRFVLHKSLKQQNNGLAKQLVEKMNQQSGR
jgi:hypothetical protein